MASENKVIVDPKIKARVIQYNLSPDDGYNDNFAQRIGYLPSIWYNAIQVDYNDIISLSLYTDSNIPSLDIVFKDTTGLMSQQSMPQDDTIISLFINSRSENIKPIHLDFKIVSFSHQGNNYQITAVVDINDLYIKKFSSFSKISSFELYKKICKETGLGMSSNFTGTNDVMTWVNPGDNLITFMNNVISNAWISKETFLYAYMDYHYYWNFIDIEKELKRDIKEESGIDSTGLQELAKIDEKETVGKLYLTNDKTFVDSPNYFEKYEFVNNSTDVSLTRGYLTKLNYYDELKKSFLVFEVDALQSSQDEAFLLRGKQNDSDFFKRNIDRIYVGKFDLDNVHKDFKYAPIQNSINYDETEKIKVILDMKTPNYNLKKFQKIFVVFSNQIANVNRTLLNPRLTGDWLVTNITYSLVGRKFRQKVELSSRVLKKSPDEIENG